MAVSEKCNYFAFRAAAVLMLASVLALGGCSSKPQPDSGIAGATPKTEAQPTPASPQVRSATQMGNGICGVAELEGFNEIENWGAWSRQDPASIRLVQPLSGPLTINLTAYALNDHSSHAMKVKLGAETKTVTLTPDVPHTFQLQYLVSAPASEIVLSGIKPVSPKEAGLGGDERKMAIGLVSIECTPATK